MTLTTASAALLDKLLQEGAANGFYETSRAAFMMNGDLTQAEKGNLLDLKVKGLVSTQDDDRGYWVVFSDEALALHPEGVKWLAFGWEEN